MAMSGPVNDDLLTTKGNRMEGVLEMKSLKAVTITSFAVMAVWALVFVADSPAALYMEDTFDYPVGDVNGASGGVGWNGSWSFTTNFFVSGAGTVEEGSVAL